MQIYPNIPATEAVKEARQKLMDRDESLKTNFSGESFPDVTADDVGMIHFSTLDNQLYCLREFNGDQPNWQKLVSSAEVNYIDFGVLTEDVYKVNLNFKCSSKLNLFIMADHTVIPVENYEISEESGAYSVVFKQAISSGTQLEARGFEEITIAKNGITFVPEINNYTLTWTNDGGLPNPDPVDLRPDDYGVHKKLVIDTSEDLSLIIGKQYAFNISSDTTFILPTPTDTTVTNTITAEVALLGDFTVNWGTDKYFNLEAPIMAQFQIYDVIWDYSNYLGWVCGAVSKG